jgi:hypothetical protein
MGFLNNKHILAMAMSFEALKLFVLFAAASYLPETSSEFLNAVFAISFWFLLLPEMMVSYEQGPHGILAKLVMFGVGTLANVALIVLALSIRNSRRAKTKTAVADL